jgi:uncharacterized protein (UPF0333 family)
MKLDIEKLHFKPQNENISFIFHDNSVLKFWTPSILIPFGIDDEYNKKLLKLEINTELTQHIHLKKIILKIENMIKKKLDLEDLEFKSILKNRPNKADLVECRLKMYKNNIVTQIEYQDKDNNYLKTIYDLEKKSNIKAEIEINGLWDFRDPNKTEKEKNKVGLTVYITKIIVVK